MLKQTGTGIDNHATLGEIQQTLNGLRPQWEKIDTLPPNLREIAKEAKQLQENDPDAFDRLLKLIGVE